VQALSVALSVIDIDRKAQIDAVYNVDPFYELAFDAHYGLLNPWATAKNMHLWTPGAVMDGRDVINDEDMLKTEFYNDFLRPQGFFSALGGSISASPTGNAFITAARPRSVDSDIGRELLKTLMPHLQCAMRLHKRIANLEASVYALVDTLDYLPGGVIIADADSRVLVMNRAAETILARNRGLRNGPDGLFASEKNESAPLRKMIAQAVAAREGALAAPVPLALARPGASRPLQVVIAPLPAQTSGTRGQPAAILFISDPDDNQGANVELLQSAFSLTNAEAALAAALMQGKTLDEVAAASGVTVATVRTHLKRLFSKTATRRQSELVGLLFSSWSSIQVNKQNSEKL
jgi:DNA-binding CsgD family transcriptional regulator/PAS domain-containing protein